MDRIKTGRESKGDRMAAVTRDGFRPVFTKTSQENRATLCAK